VGGTELQKWDIDQGLAGFVTISGKPLIQDQVLKDHRFRADIDDPNP